VEARQAVERAQTLGPNLPETQLVLGMFYLTVELDNARGLKAFEAGLARAPNDVDLLGLAGITRANLGQWDAAVAPLLKAEALDPRSAKAARRSGSVLLSLRRYTEAQAALDRSLAINPSDLQTIQSRAIVALGQGDLAGARAVVRKALTTVEPEALFAYLGTYQDLYWVLDDAQQRQLLALPPSAFDNARDAWALVRAQTYALRGEKALARAYADTARQAIQELLKATPDDGQRHALLGLAAAYLGRKAEAIQEGERAVALWPVSRDLNSGAYVQHQLVRIYMLVGEPEKAIDQLEPLLKLPYALSPGWLRIDPNFGPLKGNRRFEQLVGGGAA
jgi:serine/threonine-protein kinase